MANPARREILDNLAALFATITTGNGYKRTVSTVARYLTDWDSVGTGQYTWLGFMPEREQYKHEPFGSLYVTLPILILVHLNPTSGAQGQACAETIDDLIKAVSTDTTRGANALKTTILDVGTDEANPDFKNSKGTQATVEMRIEVTYQRTIQGS